MPTFSTVYGRAEYAPVHLVPEGTFSMWTTAGETSTAKALCGTTVSAEHLDDPALFIRDEGSADALSLVTCKSCRRLAPGFGTVEALVDQLDATLSAHPDGADVLAAALAAVAARRGSSWWVTRGRTGSWEADLVQNLLGGTVGHGDEHLDAYATTPSSPCRDSATWACGHDVESAECDCRSG